MDSSDGDPLLIHVSCTHLSQSLNGISIGSAVFAVFVNVTNRQTDTQTDRLCSVAISYCTHLMQLVHVMSPNN